MGMPTWKIGGEIFDLSTRGWIMGVLNVTPDSFSDGGRFFQAPQALAEARKMIANGANIIDVGGESTRPGAEPVDVAEEKRRVIPIIEELAAEALLSIDTSKAEVAAAALDAGAKIVNDVTGGRRDDAMWPLLAKRGAGFIIMHMQGTPLTMQRAPTYHDVVAEVADFFRQQYACALKFGIDPMTLAFDPGIGFGKTLGHNLSLLKNLPRLRVDNRPLVVGVSRKSFLGKISGHNGSIHNRLLPTVAFTSLLRMNGADVLRVHDVEEMWRRFALRMRSGAHHDRSPHPPFSRRMAQRLRDRAADGGDLLRLSLLPRHARRESVDRSGHRFSGPDFDLNLTETRRYRLDHSQFLSLPRHRPGRYFPAGTSARFGGAGRASHF